MITLKLNNKEASFKFNSSMRIKDFIACNKIESETVGVQIFELCHAEHKKELFLSIDLNNVTRIKEEIVKKKGGFQKKLTATAYTRADHKDGHLMEAYIDKQNKKHAKVVEEAMIWRARVEAERQEKGQTVAAQEAEA